MEIPPGVDQADLWYTFRVDASYDLKRTVTGIGIVVGTRVKRKKSRPGSTLIELAEAYTGVPPDLCEHFAIFRALEFGQKREVHRIQICTDYNQLRRALKRDLESGSGLNRGDLHGEILRLATGFEEVRFPWLRRRKNIQAHRLSRVAVREVLPSERNDIVWHLDSEPPFR